MNREIVAHVVFPGSMLDRIQRMIATCDPIRDFWYDVPSNEGFKWRLTRLTEEEASSFASIYPGIAELTKLEWLADEV